MLRVHAGVIASTVTLPDGTDKVIEEWSANKQGAILFGSSDLLLVSPDVYEFENPQTDLENVGRTANTYHAALVAELHKSAEEIPLFRGLSFLRAQRPEYERLSPEQLENLFKQFKSICRKHDVACRVFVGYGWADLYLDLASEKLDPFFAAVVACRGVTLKNTEPGTFRNAFTIVGVDIRRKDDAERSTEPVRPKLALRVEPSELGDLIESRLPGYFDRDQWNITITSGKRDIFIIPKDRVSFGEFWKAHRAVRQKLGTPGFLVHKMETHFDFEPKVVLPKKRKAWISKRCECAPAGTELERRFVNALKRCELMGPGLAKSFQGLARLYREALDDHDSCCDFDSAAAHYFSQWSLFDEYRQLCVKALRMAGDDSAEALKIRRRRNLIRDALDRLEVSSVFIFHQEQNGSYADLLSRSERVSLYRGGMQKINAVLLMTIDAIIARYNLPVSPMLCWWPAGQIQSERPIEVIKVPVFFLHQPEVAVFLIIHELGQLAAYESYRRLPLPPKSKFDIDIFTSADASMLAGWISDPRIETSARSDGVSAEELYSDSDAAMLADENFELSLAHAEHAGTDTGKLITDMWADVFLLRVGFGDDLRGLRDFLFEQFLNVLILERETIPSTLRSVQFVTRLIGVTAVARRFADPANVRLKVDIEPLEIEAAKNETLRYLTAALDARRFSVLIMKQKKIVDTLTAGTGQKWPRIGLVLTDAQVVRTAGEVALGYRRWLMDPMDYVRHFESEPKMPPPGLKDVNEGNITTIEPSRITSYFRQLLNVGETVDDAAADNPEKRALFRARLALVSSILASCERQPRLRKEKLRP